MKSVIPATLRNYLTIALCIVLTGLYGCRTADVDRGQRTTTSMENVNEDIEIMISHIDEVEASLNNLINQPQDVKEAYQQYSSDVDEMEKHGERLITHADEMNERGDEYFSEWEEEAGSYSNPDIQRLSRERRRELRDLYAEVIDASTDVREDLRNYISDTKEIRNFLSNDLSSRGLESVSSLVPDVIRDGERLKSSIEDVRYSIDNALSEMERPGGNRE